MRYHTQLVSRAPLPTLAGVKVRIDGWEPIQANWLPDIGSPFETGVTAFARYGASRWSNGVLEYWKKWDDILIKNDNPRDVTREVMDDHV